MPNITHASGKSCASRLRDCAGRGDRRGPHDRNPRRSAVAVFKALQHRRAVGTDRGDGRGGGLGRSVEGTARRQDQAVHPGQNAATGQGRRKTTLRIMQTGSDRQRKSAGKCRSRWSFAGPPIPELTHEQQIRRAYEIALPVLAQQFERKAVLQHWDARWPPRVASSSPVPAT